METAGKARVAIVDGDPVFRQRLAVALRREPDLDLVGEAGGAEQAIELAKRSVLDAAVVDILMPATSGISLTSELFALQPRCRVLGVSGIDDPGVIADMLRTHACGYAVKTQPVAEIVDALRQVLGGVRYLPPGVSRNDVDAALAGTGAHAFQRLTPREREVFDLLILGHSNDEVAARLVISRRTAEAHRQHIMNKLSAHSIAQMQQIAALHGAEDIE